MPKTLLLVLWAVFLYSPAFAAEEYKLDLSEIEKKPYHLGGFVEFRPVLNGLDKNAALYKTKFYNQNEGSTLQEYNSRLQLEGSLEYGIARFFMRGNADLNNTYQGWSSDTTLYEGFLSLKPSNSWTMDFGKRAFKWGKGYAFNPVAFIDRPKDPTDPELALEGFWAASLDYIRSFERGPLKTFSFTPVFLPVIYDHINDDFAGPQLSLPGSKPPPTSNQANLAGKFYFLLYDTDIDFIFFTGGSKTTRYGVDFSRNVTSNLEVHGEFAFVEDFQKKFTDQNGNLHTSDYDAVSYLLGIRYLSAKLTTFILEYYRNNAGYSRGEMNSFYSFTNTGYNTYLSSGNAAPIQKAAAWSQLYGRNNPMQNYFYLRISQQEPFDILYFTPAITSIVNLNDGSFQLIPEVLYTGVNNLELRFRTYFLVGQRDTEFGEKQNDWRVELRLRYFF